ncbi:MAG TPA: Holliday junction resolvase RuvX [Bacillota bacterium]|nr:Holliday junction resolvase RuvX [Bacillota bacterium]
MRVLGLDIGHKRIGVAVSDPLGITAQGLTVITYAQESQALQKLADICREYAVERIVAGLPLNMDGSRGEAVKYVDQFARKLKDLTGLPVIMVDERLSSRAAERALISGGMRRRGRKAVKDKIAAVLILESYLSAATPD